jgi:hypothetical protein
MLALDGGLMSRFDWPKQLETCQSRIARLEETIASQRLKIQRLRESQREWTYAQRILTLREQNLERAQGYEHLIKTRLADGTLSLREQPGASAPAHA